MGGSLGLQLEEKHLGLKGLCIWKLCTGLFKYNISYIMQKFRGLGLCLHNYCGSMLRMGQREPRNQNWFYSGTIYGYFNPVIGEKSLDPASISLNPHSLIHVLEPSTTVIRTPFFFLVLYPDIPRSLCQFPSLVLISLLSSSEPLSLLSSLTAPLYQVSLLFAYSISFPSSVIANFWPMASGFCMTGHRAHFPICVHTHRGLVSECLRGDKWILCCLATGWQNPWGEKDPFERRRQGKGFWRNNRWMQRQPAKFNRDHFHHSGGNQVILLQKLRFLLCISITRNYSIFLQKLLLDCVEICECLMSQLTTAERR